MFGGGVNFGFVGEVVVMFVVVVVCLTLLFLFCVYSVGRDFFKY